MILTLQCSNVVNNDTITIPSYNILRTNYYKEMTLRILFFFLVFPLHCWVLFVAKNVMVVLWVTGFSHLKIQGVVWMVQKKVTDMIMNNDEDDQKL